MWGIIDYRLHVYPKYLGHSNFPELATRPHLSTMSEGTTSPPTLPINSETDAGSGSDLTSLEESDREQSGNSESLWV
jgi:hypothetical protein